MAPGITGSLGVPASASEHLFDKCLVSTYAVPGTGRGQGARNSKHIKEPCSHGPFSLIGWILTLEKQKKKQLHLRAENGLVLSI